MSWKYQFKVVIIKIFKSTEVEASVYGKGGGKKGTQGEAVSGTMGLE